MRLSVVGGSAGLDGRAAGSGRATAGVADARLADSTDVIAGRLARVTGLVGFAAEAGFVRFADAAGVAGSLDVAAARLARVVGLVGSAAVAAVARFA